MCFSSSEIHYTIRKISRDAAVVIIWRKMYSFQKGLYDSFIQYRLGQTITAIKCIQSLYNLMNL